MSAHRHNHSSDTDSGKLGITIVLNLGITAAEVIGGLVSGSLALLSDAGHNLSDVIALILAYFGARGARMRAAKHSTYGYKRLEVVTAVINALSLVVISGYIINEAFERFNDPQEINSLVMLSVATVGLLGNILSVWILHRDRNNTINNRAAYLHMLYDAISSVAVIVGGIIIMFSGWYLLDLVLSVLIAMMILWSSLDILKQAARIFMEAAPKEIDVDAVAKAIAGVNGVTDVHHLHIWSISSSQVALSCHIVLDREDCTGCPQIIRELNILLREQFNIDHATIQPEGAFCPEKIEPIPPHNLSSGH